MAYSWIVMVLVPWTSSIEVYHDGRRYVTRDAARRAASKAGRIPVEYRATEEVLPSPGDSEGWARWRACRDLPIKEAAERRISGRIDPRTPARWPASRQG